MCLVEGVLSSPWVEDADKLGPEEDAVTESPQWDSRASILEITASRKSRSGSVGALLFFVMIGNG
jgi:hypothetical protein